MYSAILRCHYSQVEHIILYLSNQRNGCYKKMQFGTIVAGNNKHLQTSLAAQFAEVLQKFLFVLSHVLNYSK